jgi:phosphate transport system protein
MQQNHIRTQFDMDLDELNTTIQSMFKIVRKNIKHSMEALMKGDTELAGEVIRHDEAVNALEVQVDTLARNIIVQHQPAASDLRFVFAALKIVTDLERLGDMAVSIANYVIGLQGEIPISLASLPIMQEIILEQLKSVRHAYRDGNAQQAQLVIERDQLINDAYNNTQRVMLTFMAENHNHISQCMALTNIAKVMERIGDHISNIAEMVIYSAIGYEVRHIDSAQIKELLAGEGEED